MRIALFHNLPTGGAKRALFEHARHLANRGHVLDAYVMSTANEDYLPLAPLCRRTVTAPAPPQVASAAVGSRREGGVGVLRAAHIVRNALGVRRQVKALDAWQDVYTALSAQIDGGDYDLAYIHNCRFLSSPFLLRALRRRGKTPSVFYCQDTLRHVHEWAIETHPGYDPASPHPWGRRKVRGQVFSLPTVHFLNEQERRDAANARAADRVLVNSWYSREAMLREYGINAHVCYLGVDSRFFCPDPAVARDPSLVLSVGSITIAKRHNFVLDAIATIPPARRPHLRILGYDPLRGADGDQRGPLAESLLRRAVERDVRLEICEGVSDDVLRRSYREAAVVAFAPHLEPFGFISLEAMASATPVVGVSEAGLRETIENGVTGLLTGRDPVEYGAALDRVLSDTEFATRLGANARECASKKWTWERSTDVLEQQFARALAQRDTIDPSLAGVPDKGRRPGE